MKITARFFHAAVVLLAALVFFLPGIPAPLTARAAACTVTTDADSGPGSLRAMLTDPSCDLITFAGDYTVTLASQLTVAHNVSVDGTGHTVTVSGNHLVRVFFVNSAAIFHLTRITVANGKATLDEGGGIYNDSGTVSVTNCTFSANTATYHGGAISNSWGSLTVTSSTFSENTASSGGAIYNFDLDGTTSVTDSTFSSNVATGEGGGMRHGGGTLNVTRGTFTNNSATTGGAIYNSNTQDLIVADSNLTNNTATDGGAIYNGGDLSVTGSTFSGNTATRGGSIHSFQGTGGFRTTVANSAFFGNSATSGGGGIYNNNTTLNVTSSTFSANTGNHHGGGIYNDVGTATVTNSTFSENEAQLWDGFDWYGHGAGIHNNGTLHVGGSTFSHNQALWGGGISNAATLYVTNSTFSRNPGASYGGGLYNDAGTATVTNSTFSGNLAGYTGGGIYNTSGTVTANNSLVVNSTQGGNCTGPIGGSNNLADDGSCGASFTNSPSVLLGALGSHGGGTQTFPLLPGSAAIDATSANCPGTDQRGAARSLPTCDIGAFESQGFIFGSLAGTPQTALVNTAFAAPLGLAVTANNASEPVDGGRVTFTPPGSGASAVLASNPATIAGGLVSVSATANGTEGSYSVSANAAGVAAPATFSLTNLTHTTTALSSSANPSLEQPVTFTAIVAPTPNGGTVTFQKNGADIAGCVGVSLSAGQATCVTGALARGGNTVTAVYSGYGAYLASTSATLVEMIDTRPTIDAGDVHTCELKADGSVVCWGWNEWGQLNVPSPNADWVQITGGGAHTCGLKTDGTAQCWGLANLGQTTVPSPNSNWIQISAGGAHTCGLKADGTIACWGDNSAAQTNVPTPNANWVQVSAEGYHTCGLKADGTFACWGYNYYGQTNIPSPNENWVAVSGGANNRCGVKADGSLLCWGGNSSGQNNVPSPNENWVQAALGDTHTCGVKTDGILACWGSNSLGQLNVPGTISLWTQVAAGTHHTCGLKADGTIMCWGWNRDGQAPVVTLAPATLPNAILGTAYSQNLSASGGTAAPYTFSVVAGSPPAGLTLNADGTWSGAPASTGTFDLTVRAVDANNIAGTRDYTLVVQAEDTYADPAGLCGGNIPCFSGLQAALDAAAAGHTVTVYGGMYDETADLDRDVTVVLVGDVTLDGSFLQSAGTFSAGSWDLAVGGDLTQNGGSFAAPAGILTLAGDFSRTGGTFDPNGGTLRLVGAGDQALDPGGATLDNLAVDEGLLGYWKFDEGSGSTAQDSSGSGWQGGLVDGPAYTADRAPLSFANPYALAFDLDGSNDYVYVPDVASRRPTVFSWSLWVQWAGLDTAAVHFLTAKGVGNYELHTGGDAGVNGLRFIPAGAATLVDAPEALHAGWNHVVAVYTGAEAYLYVDGVLKATRTGISGGNDLTADGEPILMGVRLGGYYPFAGALDDVRLFNRALTGSDVAALYTSERGLAGYWKLDEGSGTAAFDSSGHGQGGTMNGSPAWITAGLAPLSFADPAALSFGGADDHVGGPAAHLPTGAHALTAVAWIRTTATARETAFSYGAADTAQAVSLNVNQLAGDGHLVVDFYGDYVDSGVAVNDGNWHQVGFSLAGHSTAIVLYVDGVAYPRTLAVLPDVAAGTNFQIGRWVTAGPGDTDPYSFAGAVDDVRVYDRALLAAEMARLHAGGEARNRVAPGGMLTLGGSFVQASGVFAGGSGGLVIDEDLTIAGGSFTAPAGVLSLSGDFTHSGGTFAHNDGTVTMVGDRVQTLSGGLTFYNLTVSPDTTVDLGLEPLFRVAGTLDNDGALRQTRPTPGGTTTEFLHVLDGAGVADRYQGLALQPAGDMGATTVTVFGNQWCPGASGGVRRCFEVQPGTAQTAAVSFYLTEAERNGQVLGSLSAWHWSGSSWERQMGATTWGGSGDGQWVRVESIAAYSPFLLAGGSPTAVVLARFEARPEGAGQRLEWQTTTEAALIGFYLYRSEAADGQLTRLNETLLPAQAPGNPLGAAYSFLDDTAVTGVSYCYWLDVLGMDGGATRQGPAIAPPWAGASHIVYLPLLQREP